MTSTISQVDAASLVWRCSPLIELHWRDWGDDSVVLEARSGQLIQFGPLSAAAMACFEEAPWRTEELIAELARDLAGQVDDQFGETVLAIVEEFHKLGWLETIIHP